MKTVYADVLFCLNFFIDFALLSVSAFILKLKLKGLRLTLCAALGGVYSVLIFLPRLSFLSSLGIKLIFSAIMTLAAFGFTSPMGYLKRLTVFYAVSFGFSGVVFGAYTFFKPSGMDIRNNAVYIDIKPFYLFLLIGIAYGGVWLFYRILPKRSEQHCTVLVTLGTKTAELTALYDSGNMLRDPISGAPVMVAELSAVERLIPKQLHRAFRPPYKPCSEAALWGHGFRLIPANGAFGKEELLASFKPDELIITDASGRYSPRNTLIAVTLNTLSSDGRYNSLIGDGFFTNPTQAKKEDII